MKATPLDKIRQAVHGRWLSAPSPEPVNITRAIIDSRKAGLGDLFIAIVGKNHDGHKFLTDVAVSGCASAIVSADTKISKALETNFAGGVIGVADTTVALGELAAMHRKSLAAQVVGVTGTVGKSTVKQMIAHILASRLTGSAAQGSFNNNIGVPLTLLDAETGDDYVICELGTNALGEIESLSRIAQPDIAVITAIGQGHLEGLKDVNRIAIEKASILTHTNNRGVVVVNTDYPVLNNALKAYDVRQITFGTTDQAQLRLTGYEQIDNQGCRFQINNHQEVVMPVLGRHNAVNALAAMAVAQRFGFDQAEAAAALADFTPVAMRGQMLWAGDVCVINDAYNANPTSMQAALAVLADLTVRRKVLIVGDMLELGDKAEELHTELGKSIARYEFAMLGCVGKLSKLAAEAAIKAGMDESNVHCFDDSASAANNMAELINPGDAVLVKASRGIAAEVIAEKILARFA